MGVWAGDRKVWGEKNMFKLITYWCQHRGYTSVVPAEDHCALVPAEDHWCRAKTMPVASASFQPAGEEELELLLAPGTVTGFKGVQEVKSGCYQAKLRNGSSFVSLPSSRSNIPGPDWCPSLGQCSRLEGFDSPRCLAFGPFLFGILVENGMRSPIQLAHPCIPSSAERMPLSLLLPL